MMKSEEPIHGFVEDRLHPVFGVDLSSGEQFQNHHWTRIQDYLKQSYISNNHCDVSIMVSDCSQQIDDHSSVSRCSPLG